MAPKMGGMGAFAVGCAACCCCCLCIGMSFPLMRTGGGSTVGIFGGYSNGVDNGNYKYESIDYDTVRRMCDGAYSGFQDPDPSQCDRIVIKDLYISTFTFALISLMVSVAGMFVKVAHSAGAFFHFLTGTLALATGAKAAATYTFNSDSVPNWSFFELWFAWIGGWVACGLSAMAVLAKDDADPADLEPPGVEAAVEPGTEEIGGGDQEVVTAKV